MNTQEVEQALRIAASCTTLIAFLGIAFKPIRTRVSKWLAELFTADIKQEMVTQVGGLRQELVKDRGLATKRHKANLRNFAHVTEGMKVINGRIDEHLEDHT